MISWEHLIYFAVPALMLSAFAAWCSYRERRALALSLALVGIAVFGVYIALMWHSLERPPMRTMGETRLWYSFFALIAGLIVYLRWRYRWILGFSTILATVFVVINLLKPEIHNKSMMPALESPYFVPHVVSYMFSYAMLGAALLITIYIAVREKKATNQRAQHLMKHGLYRTLVSYDRAAARCYLGKTGMGALLELGSQRDVGSHYTTRVSYLHTLPLAESATDTHSTHYSHYRISLPSNLLVRRQFPAFCRRC